MAQSPDLSLVLDPAEFWPDPLSCPDWPLLTPEQARHTSVIRSRDAAQAQLSAISARLNRGASVRAPTPTERQDMKARHFQPCVGSFSPQWHALGIRELRPAFGPWSEEIAGQMVAAVHLRGYLRKLDESERASAASRHASEVRRLTEVVEGAEGRERTLRDELAALAEGAARHEQRLADEKAHWRAQEITRSLSSLAFEAKEAAAKLRSIQRADAA